MFNPDYGGHGGDLAMAALQFAGAGKTGSCWRR
jgi:hypothetical protein